MIFLEANYLLFLRLGILLAMLGRSVGALHKKKQERGQARLPDPELTRFEVVISYERLSTRQQSSNFSSLKVGKVGLTPRLTQSKHFLCKAQRWTKGPGSG
jgi:hypothetical protein